MENEKLQDIENRGYRRRFIGPNDNATIQKDVEYLITALEAAEQRIATMTESYNSIGKINADQALEIRELKMGLRESAK